MLYCLSPIPFKIKRALATLVSSQKLFSYIALSLICLLGAGCASMKPISENNIRQLNHSSLAVKTGTKPAFRTFTPTTAAMSVFTGGLTAAVIDEVNDRSTKFVADTLEDPAKAIAKNLQKHVEALYSTHFVEATDNPRYILAVSSDGWMALYDPLAWGSFFLMYNASVALVNQTDGSVLASGTCAFNPKNENDLSLEELLSFETPTFANEVDRAITYCSNYFIAGLFSADGKPHHKTVTIPPRLAFLEKGPTAFPLPSSVSTTKIEPVYWQPGKQYYKEEQARATQNEIAQKNLCEEDMEAPGVVASQCEKSDEKQPPTGTSSQLSTPLFTQPSKPLNTPAISCRRCKGARCCSEPTTSPVSAPGPGKLVDDQSADKYPATDETASVKVEKKLTTVKSSSAPAQHENKGQRSSKSSGSGSVKSMTACKKYSDVFNFCNY